MQTCPVSRACTLLSFLLCFLSSSLIGTIVTGTNGVDATFEEVTNVVPADEGQQFLRLRVENNN